NNGPTSTLSSGSKAAHNDAWLQVTVAKYLPRNTLNETTVSVAGSVDSNDPYLGLPAANVLVASQLVDGGVGISMLRAGGSGGGHGDTKTWTTELKNQTTYNTWDRHHTVALTFDATLDGYSTQQDAGFGSFFFNSLADFAAGAPASYSRTLTGLHTTGSGFNGAIGLGDTFNPNTPITGPLAFGFVPPPPKPTFQYGVRLEGNQIGAHPAYNREVDSLFGVRTDHSPGGVRLMPMVGFNWPLFGTFKSNGLSLGWRALLSGGIREYRGPFATRSIDSYTRQTGLPSAIQQLYCVGAATPLPDWQAFEQGESFVPTQCANGGSAASTPLAQTAPPVALFSPDYTVSDSWRPALNFSYTINSMFRASLNGTWALNRDLPSAYDLNFNPAARFSLVSEAGRPIYVTPTSIVPSTGTESWTDSRVSPDFAHVSESRSDLRSQVRSMGATLFYSPSFFFGGPGGGFTNGSVTYTHNDAREQYRGFQSTAGDPRDVAWSVSGMAKHVVTLNVSRYQNNWGNVTVQGRFQSGARYTPSVSGDINGDGYATDRAFVFDPQAAGTDT
ncbi:MAG TPA: hypothetical protein VGH04_13845, partial [Gemmatimonadaceae bacterium]